MKKISPFVGILGVLGIIGVAMFFFFYKSPTPPAPDTNGTTFPGSGTTNTNNGQNTGVQTRLSIPAQNGETIQTLDFKHNKVSFEDPSNKGNYYLAGTNGLCNPDGTCPKAGSQTNFTTIYFASDNSFVVGLNKEPLGAVRKEAEKDLMKTLGLSESDMCRLNYAVMTSVHVNETYGGENLGFSFCPGAVKLP